MRRLAAYYTTQHHCQGKEELLSSPPAHRRDGKDPSNPRQLPRQPRRWQKEGTGCRTTKDPLPLLPNTAAKEGNKIVVRSRNICFFHARGQDSPFPKIGCRFSHEEGDVTYGFYRITVPPDAEQATNQTSYGVIVAYDLAEEDGRRRQTTQTARGNEDTPRDVQHARGSQ